MVDHPARHGVARDARRGAALRATSSRASRVGVAALVAVGSLARSMERRWRARRGRSWARDVEIRARSRSRPTRRRRRRRARPRDGVVVTRIARARRDGARRARTPSPRTQLVELKAVEPGYPFYGRLVADPDRAAGELDRRRPRARPGGAAARLGLARRRPRAHRRHRADGQRPRRAGAGPRGRRLLARAARAHRRRGSRGTGLVRPGSRVRHRDAGPAARRRRRRRRSGSLVAAAAARCRRFASRTYAQAQPGLRRFWDQLTTYLGLAGLVALLVGGIGVAVSVRAFMRQQARDDRHPQVPRRRRGGGSCRSISCRPALLGLAGSVAGRARRQRGCSR